MSVDFSVEHSNQTYRGYSLVLDETIAQLTWMQFVAFSFCGKKNFGAMGGKFRFHYCQTDSNRAMEDLIFWSKLQATMPAVTEHSFNSLLVHFDVPIC